MKKKILAVDDDNAILELLRLTFTSSGFDVETAPDAQTFRKKVQISQPDLIILDIMLGEDDGVEIYEDLLAKGFSPDIPVIFLSVLAQEIKPTPPQPGRKYALIPKPFDPEKLLKDVSAILARPKS